MSTTTTFTAVNRSQVHQRRAKRRLSTPNPRPQTRFQICPSLPHSLEALDLSPSSSPTQTLASLRFLILSYLADLERTLYELESPDLDSWKIMRAMTLEEARQWARTALEMLEGIRADVCSHLPEFHFADISVENFVRSHFPDMSDVPGLTEMRSHLPDMPDVRSRLPDMPDVRSHLFDMRSKLDDVRSRFHDIDFKKPLGYIPTLCDRLKNLHSHLSSMELPSGRALPSITPSSVISDLLDTLLSSDVLAELLSPGTDVPDEGEDILKLAAKEVKNAIKRSLNGVRLISYADLPQHWKNNPFVTQGYRFIPLDRWPLIILSLFALHNETLNIHTHLIPLVLWGINLIPFLNADFAIDTPEILFMCFALLCLLTSTIWHTMSGCAHHASMELCARVDYIGIGWLISASVGTVVYYGFQCHPAFGQPFLALCFLTGLAGNIFPFMDWFNKNEYRFYRIAFFLSLAFSAIGPLAALAMLHSWQEMLKFIGPVIPSLLSYLTGLVFYASHFPERVLPESVRRHLDYVGGGSHCIWHCFIVLAVSQHKAAISSLRNGLQCLASS